MGSEVTTRLVRLAAISTVAAASAVLLNGCYLLPGILSPRDDFTPGYRANQVATLFDKETVSGLPFTPDGTRISFEEMSEFADDVWYDSGGIPATCFDAFASSFLLTPVGNDRDEFITVGSFDLEYEEQGLLRITARVFSEPSDADAFLEQVASMTAECPTGYELTSLDPTWRVEGMRSTGLTSLALPEGFEALYHEEFPAERLEASYRDTLIVTENLAVAVSCQLHPRSPFDFAVCDSIAEDVAQRLADLR
jgi:hypothetical protein